MHSLLTIKQNYGTSMLIVTVWATESRQWRHSMAFSMLMISVWLWQKLWRQQRGALVTSFAQLITDIEQQQIHNLYELFH